MQIGSENDLIGRSDVFVTSKIAARGGAVGQALHILVDVKADLKYKGIKTYESEALALLLCLNYKRPKNLPFVVSISIFSSHYNIKLNIVLKPHSFSLCLYARSTSQHHSADFCQILQRLLQPCWKQDALHRNHNHLLMTWGLVMTYVVPVVAKHCLPYSSNDKSWLSKFEVGEHLRTLIFRNSISLIKCEST